MTAQMIYGHWKHTGIQTRGGHPGARGHRREWYLPETQPIAWIGTDVAGLDALVHQDHNDLQLFSVDVGQPLYPLLKIFFGTSHPLQRMPMMSAIT